MSKSLVVHLKNKYPDCQVYSSESVISVCRGNDEILKLQRTAHGAFEDVSEAHGLSEKFDLSPIPKDSRIHKLGKDGKICKDDEHEKRKPIAEAILAKYGKIPSVEELCKTHKDESYDAKNEKYKVAKNEKYKV